MIYLTFEFAKECNVYVVRPSAQKANSLGGTMKTITAIVALCLFVLGPSSAQPAWAWGGDGHRTVAAIAFKLLAPTKAAALAPALAAIRGGESFVGHYVNWPEGAADVPSSACTPDCILQELPKQIDVFRTTVDLETKALALSWVIHLIGDLHQPLHVADRGDRGGNDFPVSYRNRATFNGGAPERHSVRVELHSVWDTCIVVEIESGAAPVDFADALRGTLTTYRGHPAATGDIMDWASESHDLASSAAYDGLSHRADLEQPYISRTSPIVQRQLLRPGVRLAKVLDENF